ncbi:MAG: hypothetical protein E7232_06835 [Lachnospiraceae bacterium]|nr:hypothetical protein [Lachnospiraceae bacterium]
MRFLTFQPYDWRVSTQKRAIFDYLGFDAVYCINADHMDTAFINICLMTPTIPEIAMYFDADEFYLIDKAEQEKSTMSAEVINIGVASAECYREVAAEYNMNLANYIEKYHPYQFEYLIDKKAIRNELVIDVCDSVLTSLDWSDDRLIKEVNTSVTDYQFRFLDYRKEKPGNFKNVSDAVLLRSAAAYKYFELYRNGSGLFFRDYKAHFKIRKKQQSISDVYLREKDERYRELLQNYYINPDHRTLNEFCSFVYEEIYR